MNVFLSRAASEQAIVMSVPAFPRTDAIGITGVGLRPLNAAGSSNRNPAHACGGSAGGTELIALLGGHPMPRTSLVNAPRR